MLGSRRLRHVASFEEQSSAATARPEFDAMMDARRPSPVQVEVGHRWAVAHQVRRWVRPTVVAQNSIKLAPTLNLAREGAVFDAIGWGRGHLHAVNLPPLRAILRSDVAHARSPDEDTCPHVTDEVTRPRKSICHLLAAWALNTTTTSTFGGP